MATKTRKKLRYETGRLKWGREWCSLDRDDLEVMADELSEYRMAEGGMYMSLPNGSDLYLDRDELEVYSDRTLTIRFSEVSPFSLLAMLRELETPALEIVYPGEHDQDAEDEAGAIAECVGYYRDDAGVIVTAEGGAK